MQTIWMFRHLYSSKWIYKVELSLNVIWDGECSCYYPRIWLIWRPNKRWVDPKYVICLNHLCLQGLPPSLCHSLGWDGKKIESHDNNTIHKTIFLESSSWIDTVHNTSIITIFNWIFAHLVSILIRDIDQYALSCYCRRKIPIFRSFSTPTTRQFLCPPLARHIRSSPCWQTDITTSDPGLW